MPVHKFLVMQKKQSPELHPLADQMERKLWWYKGRRAIIQSLFWEKTGKNPQPPKNLQDPKNPQPPKILSVGCGTGAEIEFLQKFGDVTALDVDDESIKYCQNKGFNVIKSDINQNNLPAHSYDVIFAMDVLEHIQDDQKAVQEIHRLLKPQGHLVITVPALKCLWSKFDELGNFPHLRRYHRPELKTLLSPKFKILKLSYYCFLLFPIIFLVRKINKNPVGQMNIPRPFINNVLYLIFQAEKYLLKLLNLPFGSSLIAISQKK